MKCEIRDGVLEIADYLIRVKDINAISVRRTKFFWGMIITPIVAYVSLTDDVQNVPDEYFLPFMIGALSAVAAMWFIGFQFGTELVIGTPAEAITIKLSPKKANEVKDKLASSLKGSER